METVVQVVVQHGTTPSHYDHIEYDLGALLSRYVFAVLADLIFLDSMMTSSLFSERNSIGHI